MELITLIANVVQNLTFVYIIYKDNIDNSNELYALIYF